MSYVHILDEPIYETARRDKPLIRPLTSQEKNNEIQFKTEQSKLIEIENNSILLMDQYHAVISSPNFFKYGEDYTVYEKFISSYIREYYIHIPVLRAKLLFYWSCPVLWLNHRLKYLSHYDSPEYKEPWDFLRVDHNILKTALNLISELQSALDDLEKSKILVDNELDIIKQQLDAAYNPQNINLHNFKEKYRSFQAQFELTRGLVMDLESLSVKLDASWLGSKGSFDEDYRAYAFGLAYDHFSDELGWLEYLSKPIYLVKGI